VLPLICWVYTLISATRTFAYKILKTNLLSPRAAKEVYLELLNYKTKLLKKAFLGLIVGFVFLIINIIVYLEFYPVIK